MLTDAERYLFDLQGYLLIEDVLQPGELADLNRALDEYDLWNEPPGHGGFFDFWRNGDRQILARPLHRFAGPFRNLLGHTRIVPYLANLLGKQSRYGLMRKGGGPFHLHGGAVPWEPGMRFQVAEGAIPLRNIGRRIRVVRCRR